MKSNIIQRNIEYSIYLFNYCGIDGLDYCKIHPGFTVIRNHTDDKNSME